MGWLHDRWKVFTQGVGEGVILGAGLYAVVQFILWLME